MPAATPADVAPAALARRVAPIVVHDHRDRSPLTSVGAARVTVPGVARRPPRPTVYARVIDGGGGRWVQFWLFFEDNPQDRGIVRTGRHEGDWEVAQVRVDARGRPEEIVVSQHSTAERCRWSETLRRGTRPLLFAANGSHALYLRRGTRDRRWPDPNDEARGDGIRVRPRLRLVSEGRPRWMRWPGRWGRSRAGWVPGEMDSPRGPPFQGTRWSDPGVFADSARGCVATACRRAGTCDMAESAMAGSLAVLVTLIAIGAMVRKRRSNGPGRGSRSLISHVT